MYLQKGYAERTQHSSRYRKKKHKTRKIYNKLITDVNTVQSRRLLTSQSLHRII